MIVLRRFLAITCLIVAATFPVQEASWELAPPAPVVPLHPEGLDDLVGYSCAGCHEELVHEWSQTAHAISWVDHVYQDALERKRRPELCHPCHVPEPLLLDEPPMRPEARASDLRLGISCEACHLGEGGVVLGPRGTPTEAHDSTASERMTPGGSVALCAACHATSIGPVIGVAKDFLASGQAERGRSCVGCHMAPVDRAWAKDAPVREGRSHAIQTPRDPSFLRRAFDPRWIVSDEGSRVVLANRAGHRVPGLIGRELRFRAELLDDSGSVVERAELTIDASAYLPVDGTREIALEQEGHEVHLLGEHHDPRAEQPVVFLDERLLPAER